MANIKKYSLAFIYAISSILIVLFLETTLYYFNLLTPTLYNILKIVTLLLTLLINGFVLGRKAKSKGYLEGLKLSGMLIIFFVILSLLLTKSFHLKYLLYYLILLLSTTLGTMIGVNHKKEL